VFLVYIGSSLMISDAFPGLSDHIFSGIPRYPGLVHVMLRVREACPRCIGTCAMVRDVFPGLSDHIFFGLPR